MHSLQAKKGRFSDCFRAFLSIVWMGCVLQSSSTQATAVRTVTVNELLTGASLIFHGRVIDRRITRDANDMVMSKVRFEILEVVKGEYEANQIDLTFLGGAIGRGVATVVSGQAIPEIGEEGIYFVESLSRQQINPIYGWDQGRFLIDGNLTEEHVVRSADGRPVTTLILADRPVEMRLSDGVAEGVLTLEEQPSARPLTPEEFKMRLRELLRELPR